MERPDRAHEFRKPKFCALGPGPNSLSSRARANVSRARNPHITLWSTGAGPKCLRTLYILWFPCLWTVVVDALSTYARRNRQVIHIEPVSIIHEIWT